jgi:hypothetical protein
MSGELLASKNRGCDILLWFSLPQNLDGEFKSYWDLLKKSQAIR